MTRPALYSYPVLEEALKNHARSLVPHHDLEKDIDLYETLSEDMHLILKELAYHPPYMAKEYLLDALRNELEYEIQEDGFNRFWLDLVQIQIEQALAWVHNQDIKPQFSIGDELSLQLQGSAMRGTILAVYGPLAQYIIDFPKLLHSPLPNNPKTDTISGLYVPFENCHSIVNPPSDFRLIQPFHIESESSWRNKRA